MNRGVIQIDRKVWEEIGSPELHKVHDALLLPDGLLIAQLKPVYQLACEPAEEKDFLERHAVFDHMEIHGEAGS